MSASPPEPPVVHGKQGGVPLACPHCREPVDPKAYVCPHCRKRLRMAEALKGGLIVAAVVLACIVAATIVMRHESSRSASPDSVAADRPSRSRAVKESPIDALAKTFERQGFPIIEGSQAFTRAGEKGVTIDLVASRWETMSGEERRHFLHLEAWKACEADLGVDIIEFRSAGKALGRLEHDIFHEP